MEQHDACTEDDQRARLKQNPVGGRGLGRVRFAIQVARPIVVDGGGWYGEHGHASEYGEDGHQKKDSPQRERITDRTGRYGNGDIARMVKGRIPSHAPGQLLPRIAAVARAYDAATCRWSTVSRSASISTPARQKGGAAATASGDVAPARCMGRSRRGLTAKIPTVRDANSNPIAFKLSEGHAHEGRSSTDLLDSVGAGEILLADRGYDSYALLATMAKRGAWANIKPTPHRVDVPAFSSWLYRYHNLAKRCFDTLKHFRTVATRFEKHDAS